MAEHGSRCKWEVVGGTNIYLDDTRYGEAETPEFAAFIVRACNSHDELVRVLERIVEADEQQWVGYEPKTVAYELAGIARVALARAEGKDNV